MMNGRSRLHLWRRLLRRLKTSEQRMRYRNDQRVFIVGRNKTGTSTVTAALSERGLAVYEGAEARLFDSWCEREFAPIVDRCRESEVFADVPFGLPDTYKILDREFPFSKFVLTVWPTSDDWFDAFTRFHSRKIGGGSVPSAEQLAAFGHRRPGYVADVLHFGYGVSREEPYQRWPLIAAYERHNEQVIDYFRDRPDDLLVLDISRPEALGELCRFVGLEPTTDGFVLGKPDHNFAEHAHPMASVDKGRLGRTR